MNVCGGEKERGEEGGEKCYLPLHVELSMIYSVFKLTHWYFFHCWVVQNHVVWIILSLVLFAV